MGYTYVEGSFSVTGAEKGFNYITALRGTEATVTNTRHISDLDFWYIRHRRYFGGKIGSHTSSVGVLVGITEDLKGKTGHVWTFWAPYVDPTTIYTAEDGEGGNTLVSTGYPDGHPTQRRRGFTGEVKTVQTKPGAPLGHSVYAYGVSDVGYTVDLTDGWSTYGVKKFASNLEGGTVKAPFIKSPTLEIETDVDGGGAATCAGYVTVDTAQKYYSVGEEVTLTATPQPGYLFKEWGGDGEGSQNPTTVIMDSDKKVTAVFEGITIVIDPGHGGLENDFRVNAMGAEGLDGIWEKDLTLDLAFRVKSQLENIPIPFKVLMTRTADVPMRFDDRPKFARENEANIFISIHFNAKTYGAPHIMQGIIRENGTSQVNYIQDDFLRDWVTLQTHYKYQAGTHEARDGNYMALSDKFLGDGDENTNPTYCNIAAMILEINYIRNSDFHQIWNLDENHESFRDEVALGIANGIYLKYCYEN